MSKKCMSGKKIYEVAAAMAKVPHPTIEVAGRASYAETPQIGSTTVTLSGSGTTPQEAWAAFHDQYGALRTALDGIGNIGATTPTETSEEISKALRTITETTVSAEVSLKFDPAKFGDVLKALVTGRIKFTSPEFEFAKQPTVTHELLEEASRDAKQSATSIAAGVGARVGRLIKIHIGEPVRYSDWTRLADLNTKNSWWNSNAVFSMTTLFNKKQDETPNWDDQDWTGLDISTAGIRSYETVAVITATFELIESTDEEFDLEALTEEEMS